jgi:penicillin-binding protein 1A
MSDRSNRSAKDSGESVEHPTAAPTQPVQTLAAGRALLVAVGRDLGRLGRWIPGAISSRVVVKLAKAFVALAILALLMVTGAMAWALHDLPAEKPIGGDDEPAFLLESADGQTMGRVGRLILPDAARADFSDNLVNAVISIEDRHFYSNLGFDPEGILRALRRNVDAGTVVEGGSTITQQLVKVRYLGHERTLKRKLREALVAAWLDLHLSKDEILTRYLNSVYLGNGAYGMPAAARLYFDKPCSDLTLPEAAMLAGMIRAPSRDNPIRALQASRQRADVVIDAMRDNGVINAQAAEEAKLHPATPHPAPLTAPARTWFANWIGTQAAAMPVAFSSDTRLRTTLMPEVQKAAEQAVDEVLDHDGAQRHVSQAALVAMRPDGAVVAMVGGRDYDASSFNRAVDAQRQPGSAFKLFVYLAALRKGLSIDDTIDASPIDIKGWKPNNFDDRHFGRVTLADAFAESINTAAARLGQQVGLDNVIAAARDLGLSGTLPAVPSLALGSADVSLLDLTAAYAAVKAGKAPIKPWGISGFGVETNPRLQSMGPPIAPTQSLQPYQKPLLELLQDVVSRGTGRGAALSGFAAGKTGTSEDFRDAWFIGFNDALVVGVWVGNDDNSPTNHVTGGSLPAAIWKRFMTDATPIVTQSAPPVAAAPPETGTPPAPAGPTTPATPDQPSPNQSCDVQACARTYSSFRASDCTYKPFHQSSRRLCAKSSAQKTASTPPAQPSQDQASVAGGQCNVDACAGTYSSFDAASCTYQPYDGGPRRRCEK